MTSFSVVARSFSPNLGEMDHVFLERQNWDDYGFKTLFHVTYSTPSGDLVKLGQVKIIKRDMTYGDVLLDRTFQALTAEYCSLGQDQTFYETLAGLTNGAGFRILDALRDIVWTPDITKDFLAEPSFSESLTRSVDSEMRRSFRDFLTGQHRQSTFRFSYYFDEPGATLDFQVEPKSVPPTNVHAIIGRNGTGKTTLLGRMAEAVCLNAKAKALKVSAC